MGTDVEDELHNQWSQADLVNLLEKNTVAEDARLMRVLAARIAERADESDDPLMLTTDLHHTLTSLAEAVRTIAEPRAELDEMWKAEQMTEAVMNAATEVRDLAGWF